MNSFGLETASLSFGELKNIIEKIKNLKLGVIGDGCIDIYWEADMTLSELSRETPHHPLPVVGERISLGGGTNVAANMKALGAGFVTVLTFIGEDWRGEQLIKLLKTTGIDTGNIITSSTRITPAYCKPMRRGISDMVYEDPRLDFENYTPLSEEDEEMVLKQLDVMINQVDVVAVCDQFLNGIITVKIRKRLEEISNMGKIVVVDSRSRINLYKNVIIKPNEVECIRAVYPDLETRKASDEDIYNAAMKLNELVGRPLVVTYGSKGSLWVENNKIIRAFSKAAEPPVDIVGAGDTFMSAFCSAYGAGTSGDKSIAFANIASGIVVKKIRTTGTAKPEEILQKFEEMNYGE